MAGDEERDGKSSKSNDDGNKRAMATAAKVMVMATKRAMATAGEGDVNNGKRDGQQ